MYCLTETFHFQFLHLVIFLKILNETCCELPSSFYSRPIRQHFTPTFPPGNIEPPPAIPSTSYGIPEGPSAAYDAPSQASAYGPPTQAPPNETPAPIIHKHVYVHIPPPEPEYPTPQRPVQTLPAQKHYRIIFIKAPTQAIPTRPPLSAAPETEEKTIVYVLVRKPDDMPEIVVPTPASTIPSKPEVYFIRYKAEEATTSTPETVSESGGYYKK